jgi:HNH endonuclease
VSAYIPESLKTQVEQTDRQRCCYCLTSQANSGIPMTHDHILPRSKGGGTSFQNLCLACRTCNEFKSDTTQANDPLTGVPVQLFNPRLQKWTEHFTWNFDSTKVEGLTATGRATIVVLRMNNAIIVSARWRWAISGWHPPIE